MIANANLQRVLLLIVALTAAIIDCTGMFHPTRESWEASYKIARGELKPGMRIRNFSIQDDFLEIEPASIRSLMPIPSTAKAGYASLILKSDQEESRKATDFDQFRVAYKNAIPALFIISTTQQVGITVLAQTGNCFIKAFAPSAIINVDFIKDNEVIKKAISLPNLEGLDHDRKAGTETIRAINDSIQIYKGLGFEVPVVFCD